MSRQESRRRDLGKSLAQPENSVSFFVNRRVSQASKATHFLLPCIHIHDVLVARDTLIWWMSFPPVPHNVLIVVYCGDPDVGYGSCLERERDGGGTPPKPGFSGQWMPSFQESRTLSICTATLTGRGTSLPHPPGLGCHIG